VWGGLRARERAAPASLGVARAGPPVIPRHGHVAQLPVRRRLNAIPSAAVGRGRRIRAAAGEVGGEGGRPRHPCAVLLGVVVAEPVAAAGDVHEVSGALVAAQVARHVVEGEIHPPVHAVRHHHAPRRDDARLPQVWRRARPRRKALRERVPVMEHAECVPAAGPVKDRGQLLWRHLEQVTRTTVIGLVRKIVSKIGVVAQPVDFVNVVWWDEIGRQGPIFASIAQFEMVRKFWILPSSPLTKWNHHILCLFFICFRSRLVSDSILFRFFICVFLTIF
jgi:hypothetical protein